MFVYSVHLCTILKDYSASEIWKDTVSIAKNPGNPSLALAPPLLDFLKASHLRWSVRAEVLCDWASFRRSTARSSEEMFNWKTWSVYVYFFVKAELSFAVAFPRLCETSMYGNSHKALNIKAAFPPIVGINDTTISQGLPLITNSII